MKNKALLLVLFGLMMVIGNGAFGQSKSQLSQLQPTLSHRGPSEEPKGELPLPVFTVRTSGKTATFRLPDYQNGIDAEYFWDFGDGEQSFGLSPDQVHTYPGFGTYLVTIVVVSGDQKASFNAMVSLRPALDPSGRNLKPAQKY